jgi:LuxR family transcriptional regulator, maltose regulon positive regulatory protein
MKDLLQDQQPQGEVARALDPLVSSKLHPSRARPKLVARPRLVEILTRDTGHRLTLLSAPAGFGKTTLLNEWSRDQECGGRSVAWVTLDEGDNDPVRFLSYLVAALRRSGGEGFGEGVLAALRSPEPPRMEAVLGALINELADLPAEVVVVLDDYHVIDSEGVHRIVSFLLERLPEGAHLVVSSRIDPPLPLARLRARGQMTELHAGDLRFTPEQAAAFLNDVMGLDLSEGDIAALEGVTEGWIAALQLAALSMKGRKDVSGFIQSFSGSHRDVFDFLAEEVLGRQAEQVQSFLLETSILDRLSGPLCDALTGRDDGQRTLEKLERENLLVVPLDDDRVWYRYHHLFADFLRGSLERERPEELAPLHLRASEWCEENALVAEAVLHALAAGDNERAARLMEGGIGQTWYRGEVVTLLGWLRKLPEETMRRRPLLLVWYAAALMLVGRPDGVEALLDEAERAVGAEGLRSGGGDPQHVRATAAAVRSLHARLRGDPPGAIEQARRALALLPEDNLNPRPFAAHCLAEAYRAADDLEAATDAFAQTAELGRAAGHDYIALAAMGSLAQLRMAQGRLREADTTLRHALGFAAEREAELLPAVGRVRIGLGELLYERDDLDASERELTLGTELAERAGELDVLVRARVALSQARRARGDTVGALDLAHEAERMARDSGVPQATVWATLWKARLHLMRGELQAATDLERATEIDDVPSSTRESERASLARLLIAREDHDGALQLLDGLRGAAEVADGRGGPREIEILALRALALRARDEKTRAIDVIEQALALGQPEGYVRIFVDEGPAMAVLLSETLEARQRGRLEPADEVPTHYLRKLTAALEREASGDVLPDDGLFEPLSERELEVLQLIAAGKSNRQIATDLFVSVGTVKTHVNNLYRKLDAHNRTQAVARARELNLL